MAFLSVIPYSLPVITNTERIQEGHIKVTGMLVVSLGGVNRRFYSVSVMVFGMQKLLYLPFQVLFRAVHKEIYKKCHDWPHRNLTKNNNSGMTQIYLCCWHLSILHLIFNAAQLVAGWLHSMLTSLCKIETTISLNWMSLSSYSIFTVAKMSLIHWLAKEGTSKSSSRESPNVSFLRE